MSIWDSMGRVVVYKASDEKAARTAEYLIKQGISAVVYHDADDDRFAVTVPACDEGKAVSLLSSRGKSSVSSYIDNLRHAPQRARASHVESDSSRAALVFLICGGVVFIIALTEFIIDLVRGNAPMHMAIIELVLGTFFIIFGILQLVRARKHEREKQKEEAFTQSVVRWMASTYSGDDIDSIILRGASFDDLETSRRAIIQNYIVREFDVPDESYIVYLTSQSYSAIYELHAIK